MTTGFSFRDQIRNFLPAPAQSFSRIMQNSIEQTAWLFITLDCINTVLFEFEISNKEQTFRESLSLRQQKLITEVVRCRAFEEKLFKRNIKNFCHF